MSVVIQYSLITGSATAQALQQRHLGFLKAQPSGFFEFIERVLGFFTWTNG